MFWLFAFFGMAGGSGCGPAELEPSAPAGFTEATAALLASDVGIAPVSLQAKYRLALAYEHFNLPRFPGGLPGREGIVPHFPAPTG
jgi:hypothetical protein